MDAQDHVAKTAGEPGKGHFTLHVGEPEHGGPPAPVHVAPEQVPSYVRRARRNLADRARLMRTRPNSAIAADAAAGRGEELETLRRLAGQVGDPLLRAEIMGLVSYYSAAV